MHISKLYPNIKDNIIIRGLSNDPKRIKLNYIFYDCSNHIHDVNEAINNGCKIIASKRNPNLDNILWIKCNNPKKSYIKDLKRFYHYNNDIYTIGVIGTNGKSTIINYLSSVFKNLEIVGCIDKSLVTYLNHTYNLKNKCNAKDLYSSYNLMSFNKVNKLCMELSEYNNAFEIESFNLNALIITNLTYDGNNFMDERFLSMMKKLKSLNYNSLLIYNHDNKYIKNAKHYTKAKAISYGEYSGDYKLGDYVLNMDGSIFDVLYKDCYLGTFKTHLFGKHNILNALAVIAYSYEMGIPLKLIQKGIKNVEANNLGFCKYQHDGLSIIIDKEHSLYALKCLLENARLFTKGKLIIVIDDTSDDKKKRQLIGKIASNMTDITIFTTSKNDDSFFNNLYDLIGKVKNKDYYLCIEMLEAINLALALSNKNDTIVIIGNYEKIAKEALNT